MPTLSGHRSMGGTAICPCLASTSHNAHTHWKLKGQSLSRCVSEFFTDIKLGWLSRHFLFPAGSCFVTAHLGILLAESSAPSSERLLALLVQFSSPSRSEASSSGGGKGARRTTLEALREDIKWPTWRQGRW